MIIMVWTFSVKYFFIAFFFLFTTLFRCRCFSTQYDFPYIRNLFLVRFLLYFVLNKISFTEQTLILSFFSWWRHQMETFSALLAICAGNSPVPGEFPAQRPVTRSFDAFFDLHPNKRLSKLWWGWWFDTLSCSLWRHRNVERKQSSITTLILECTFNLAKVYIKLFARSLKLERLPYKLF